MNKATQNLENDHDYILRLIDVMERMVIDCTTNTSHMELVVSLIKNYADGFHHAKEENLLFPLLVQKGFSNDQGPLSVMLHEHAEGRNFVKGMTAGIASYKKGDDSLLPEIYRNMQGYIDLLRAHIDKENKVLFRMADRVISVVEQDALMNEFAAVEAKDYSNGKIQQFITDIEGLEVIYSDVISTE
jgi:hemerythrin-like domain-containing protein